MSKDKKPIKRDRDRFRLKTPNFENEDNAPRQNQRQSSSNIPVLKQRNPPSSKTTTSNTPTPSSTISNTNIPFFTSSTHSNTPTHSTPSFTSSTAITNVLVKIPNISLPQSILDRNKTEPTEIPVEQNDSGNLSILNYLLTNILRNLLS